VRGRPGALPPAGYRRPDLLDEGGLVVRVVGEGGRDNGTYDFRDAPGAEALRCELVAAFARAASSTGDWSSRRTLIGRASGLRRFLRFAANRTPAVTCVPEITPAVWREWVLFVGGAPANNNRMRSLLRYAALPAETRALVDARNIHPRPALRLGSYSVEEFRLIRTAARRTVDAACRRIDVGVGLLADGQAGRLDADSEQGRWAVLLQQISLTGGFPWTVYAGGYRDMPKATRDLVGTSSAAWMRLYPTVVEVGAAAVLLICHEGWNLSTVAEMDVPDQRPNGEAGSGEVAVHRVATVKRRRPRQRRHASNNLVDTGAGSSGRVMAQVVAMTAPARTTLAGLGEPTGKLLIGHRRCDTGAGWFDHGNAVHLEDWIGRWSRQAAVSTLAGTPVVVSAQRLRRTVQVQFGGPRHNTAATHENVYLMRDPRVRAESADVVAEGLHNAVDHAVRQVAMRLVRHPAGGDAGSATALATQANIPVTVAEQVHAGTLDTPTGACLDFEHSPFTPTGPCAVSFLLCFACPNALATDRHLPRIVHLHEAMTTLRSTVDAAVWNADWAQHHQRVSDLLDTHTSPAERRALHGQVTDIDRELINAMLTRRLDP
jgi:hypothetical protein